MAQTIYCGWDIGGAHLKVASVNNDGDITSALQLPSPLWKGLGTLVESLKKAATMLPHEYILHSVTTTAELADIFTDRRQGLTEINKKLAHVLGDGQFSFYAGSNGLVPSAQFENYSDNIASSNWHATASYIARLVNRGILVDIGSTTTDIIPFANGEVINEGNSDFERMQTSELVYTGIIRTPVMAIVERVPYLGQWVNIAAEHFATMADIFRLTGELDESNDMMDSADGAGKEVTDSARRLARMLGTDFIQLNTLPQWKLVAGYIAEQQLLKIQQSLINVVFKCSSSKEMPLIGAGSGRFVVKKLARRNGLRYIDITELLNVSSQMREAAARCATAVSVAQITRWAA